MTKYFGILLSLFFATVSCSSSPNKWEDRQPSQVTDPVISLDDYVLPSDATTVKTLRDLRAGLAFSGKSSDTTKNIDKVKADIEKRLKMILTVTSGSYTVMAQLDKELDAAVAANQSFDLAQSSTYAKSQKFRQNIDAVEARMLATYVQLWKYALKSKKNEYPVSKGRQETVSARAREILAFVHAQLANYTSGPRSIGLINLREKCDMILDSIALDLSSQTQGSRDALAPLSQEFGQIVAQMEKTESANRSMPLQDYKNSLNAFITAVGKLDEDTQKLIDREPQSNVLVEGFVNKSGSDFGTNKWVLTFDDGPNKTRTRNIAKVLADNGVKGEFFWLSQLVSGNGTLAKEIYDAGHHVNSHSIDHADLTKQSAKRIHEEVSGSRDTIEKTLHDAGATSYKMVNFRCPYGACWAPKSKAVQQEIKDAGLIHIFWNVDSLDWQDKNTNSVLNRVVKSMQSNKRGIILFHDIHPVAEAVLPELFKSSYVKDNKIQWLQL